MSQPVRIWLAISHHTAFRIGGWAYVRADGALLTGHAGGDRRTDAERAALAGLVAALKGVDGSQPMVIRTTSALVAAVPARISAARSGGEAPEEHLDFWAQAATALAKASVQIVRVEAPPGSPSAFAAAWAELARDKAKDKGPFAAAIPKSNLAKAGVEP
jgi:ribonuclease HI